MRQISDFLECLDVDDNKFKIHCITPFYISNADFKGKKIRKNKKKCKKYVLENNNILYSII